MNYKNLAAMLLLIAFSITSFSGCGINRAEPPSAADVFEGVTCALFDILLRDDEPSIPEQRRQWQCENLSADELDELGISSQCHR